MSSRRWKQRGTHTAISNGGTSWAIKGRRISRRLRQMTARSGFDSLFPRLTAKGRVMKMKTAFYWPAFLGPLGKQADFWGVANLLMESVTASDLELFVDTESSRPALARLFGEIRRGRVRRIIIRSLSDLCLTPEEVMRCRRGDDKRREGGADLQLVAVRSGADAPGTCWSVSAPAADRQGYPGR